MKPTLPLLLEEYRRASAAYDAARAFVEERDRAGSLSVQESNAAYDALHEEYFEPFHRARSLLLSAVCLEHGMDPRRPVPRPVSARIGGALVVVAPDWNDPADSHVHVVEPADVIASVSPLLN